MFFLLRELETYKFQIDGERLGEQWFTFEAVAVWVLVTGLLSFLRLLFRSTQVRTAAQPQMVQAPDQLAGSNSVVLGLTRTTRGLLPPPAPAEGDKFHPSGGRDLHG